MRYEPELLETHPLDRPIFIAAALRGWRLQRTADAYALYQRRGETLVLLADGLSFKDVANRCGAAGTTTLRQAVERDGLIWPDTFEEFLALAGKI
uniref:hypothetical protein n=1 Tax=Cupriavidus taiwanensis TaxID=164546 RepID=UPI003F495AA6